MLLVFQLYDAVLEEIVGIVPVEGDAGAEHVYQGESLVVHGPLYQLGQVADVAAVTAGDVGCAVHYGTGNGVDRGFHAAVGGALGAHAVAAGGGNLASGKTVDLVVHHNIGQVYVAAGGVSEVIAADTVAVPIAAGNEHRQIVVRQLGAGGHGQGTPMKGVHPVGVEVARQVGRAPNTADCQYLMGLQTHLGAGPLQ